MFKQAPRRDEDSTRRRRQRTISSQEFIFRIFKYLVLIFFLDDRPVWLLLLCVSRPNSRLHSAYLGSCVHGVFGLSRAVPTENHSTNVWLCASARIKRRRKARNGADGNRLITSRPASRVIVFYLWGYDDDDDESNGDQASAGTCAGEEQGRRRTKYSASSGC